jgi:hypothetical protein
VIEERLLRRSRPAGLELDPGSTHFDARTVRRTWRSGPEAERTVLRGRRLRIGRAQRNVVEVVVEVGVGLDETERNTFAQLEVRLALAPPLDLEVGRQLGERLVEKSVSFPRRASAPTSVNASVRSITCIPR